MGVVSAQRAVVRRRREENHVRASVVFARAEEVTGWFGAGDAALQCYSVTYSELPVSIREYKLYDISYERMLTRLETGHGLSNLQDLTRTLVSQSIISCHDHRSNMAMFPEVDV